LYYKKFGQFIKEQAK